MDAEHLRYRMKHLDALCPNRSVANRVESIQDKIYKVLIKSTNKGEK